MKEALESQVFWKVSLHPQLLKNSGQINQKGIQTGKHKFASFTAEYTLFLSQIVNTILLDITTINQTNLLLLTQMPESGTPSVITWPQWQKDLPLCSHFLLRKHILLVIRILRLLQADHICELPTLHDWKAGIAHAGARRMQKGGVVINISLSSTVILKCQEPFKHRHYLNSPKKNHYRHITMKDWWSCCTKDSTLYIQDSRSILK